MPIVRIKNCLNCGIAHEWVFTGPTLKELRLIKSLTSLSAVQFAAAGDEADPDALAALLVVLHKRDKINVSFDDVDLDFEDFEMQLTDEEADQQAKLETEMKLRADQAQSPKLLQSGQPKKVA